MIGKDAQSGCTHKIELENREHAKNGCMYENGNLCTCTGMGAYMK
jgi:hypothetical protein